MTERRIKAIVEYSGANYSGFQRQSELASVQGVLEMAAAATLGQASRVTAAGRTDAGAHALGQVISFTADSRLDDQTMLRAINAHLPCDVALQSLATVEPEFDPRRHATGREYHYLVLRRAVPSPLWEGRAHRVGRLLDVTAMRAAASILVGAHDFGAFGLPEALGSSTVREIFRFEVVEQDELLRFEIYGSGFMRHMIRAVIGTLLEVGVGRLKEADITALLSARTGKRSAPPVPAHGLYLVNVTYGPGAEKRESHKA